MSDPVPAVGSGAFRIAWTVSIVLHPFAVFTALTLLAAWRLDPTSLPRVALGMAVVVAVVWAFVWQRHRAGHWGTVDASSRHERPLLYAVVLALMLAYAAWLGRASPLASGVVAVIALLCVAGLANRWIKLSLHMASLAFCAMALWPIDRRLALFAFALLPLLGWARLRMAAHGARSAGRDAARPRGRSRPRIRALRPVCRHGVQRHVIAVAGMRNWLARSARR